MGKKKDHKKETNKKIKNQVQKSPNIVITITRIHASELNQPVKKQ